MSIVYASRIPENNPAGPEMEQAILFIIYAAVFDMADGMIARLLKTSSDFGVELDSLSDVISFGAAPSFLLYKVFFHNMNEFGIALASLIMVFAALRLARFNVQLVGYDKEKFSGIPTPVAAITVCVYLMHYHNKIFNEYSSKILIILLGTLLPLLMVSKFTYPTFPPLTKSSVLKHKPFFILILIAVVVSVITMGKAVFWICSLYILSGIILFFFRTPKKKSLR